MKPSPQLCLFYFFSPVGLRATYFGNRDRLNEVLASYPILAQILRSFQIRCRHAETNTTVPPSPARDQRAMQGEEPSMEIDSGPTGLQNSQHARAVGTPEIRVPGPGPAIIPATQPLATQPLATQLPQILKRPTQQNPPSTKADEYEVFVALVKGGNLREAFNRV